MLLTEHIARCEAEGIDFNSYWFKSTLGRLQEVFFQVNIFNLLCKNIFNFNCS